MLVNEQPPLGHRTYYRALMMLRNLNIIRRQAVRLRYLSVEAEVRSELGDLLRTQGRYAEGLAEFTDEIAERAIELGGVALGTIQIVTKQSRLAAYPLNISPGKDHVVALSSSLANFGASTRDAIDTAGKGGDADTADLFTEVSRGVDKLLWFVEVHAQAKE